MGFTTGFLGGATLTYSILYLSLYLHRANRSVQHTILSQQSTTLNSLIDPLPAPPAPPAYEVREEGLVELLKDRWNGEVEGLVRRAQTTDWNLVRERWERRVGNVWANLRKTDVAGEVEARWKENVVGTGDAAEGVKPVGTTTDGPRLLELK